MNLPREDAAEHREQVGRLQRKLENYLEQHRAFTLRKMILSGSLAKGTALRSLNDIDVACYISGADAPQDVPKLLEYLAERLRKAFANFKPDQVQPQTYSVTVSFRGSGLDVDVVPILYDGDPDWYGNLISQDDGSLLLTSIPRHLAFSVKRRRANERHFAQVVRLLKFWAKKEKAERDDGFRCKSFLIELIVSHLADRGTDLSDYPDALQAFFTYVAKTGLKERIVFTDYYAASSVNGLRDPVQVIDPVNAKNNVACLYTSSHADLLVEAALDAGDAIDAALYATTKGDTVRYWQKVLGTSFTA